MIGLLTAILAVSSLMSCKNSSQEQPVKKVVIYGTISNYEQDTLFMDDYTSNYKYLEANTHKIPLNKNNEFSYTFTLEEPRYFKISRTYLYLSPGDSLEMKLDTGSRADAIFKGQGADANNYLRSLPYPKGGSFFGELRDRDLKLKSKEEMVGTFKPILDEKLTQVQELTNVSNTFKELETARLYLEYANTLESSGYLYYSDYYQKKITEDEMNAKIADAETYLTPYIVETYKKIDYNNVDYLQFEVFQGSIFTLNNDEYITKNNLTPLNNELKDYIRASNLKYAFTRQGYTKEFLDYYNEEIVKIKEKKYIGGLTKELDKYKLLKPGSPAPQITFTNLKGEEIPLSTFHGKVVVIDLWATWCGPCMVEKPYYEALVEKYKDNDNIVLLAVSIDTHKVWTNYFTKEKEKGIQLHINRSDLAAYQIYSIPRFFVIDKDQNIVDVYAPLPSTGKLEEMFKEIL